jgi:excisionase family DNA binding protein
MQNKQIQPPGALPKRSTYTTRDIAQYCGVDPITVARWFDGGALSGYRTPGGHRRVTSEELVAFLNRQGMPLPQEHRLVKVLVIDDDEDLLKLLGLVLRKKGHFEVFTSNSGIDGLLRMGVQKPDLVLLDVFMAGVDGREVLRRLRENPDLAHIGVAFMTARLTPPLLAELQALRPIDVFKKPLDVNRVTERLLAFESGARRHV